MDEKPFVDIASDDELTSVEGGFTSRVGPVQVVSVGSFLLPNFSALIQVEPCVAQ